TVMLSSAGVVIPRPLGDYSSPGRGTRKVFVLHGNYPQPRKKRGTERYRDQETGAQQLRQRHRPVLIRGTRGGRHLFRWHIRCLPVMYETCSSRLAFRRSCSGIRSFRLGVRASSEWGGGKGERCTRWSSSSRR